MKIDEEGRFPHPVLSRDTGDYLAGEFSIALSVEEALQATQVTIGTTVQLTESTLLSAIKIGRADIGFFVTCLDTYYSKLIPIGLAGGQLSFEPGILIGKVTLRPMVWSHKQIENFPLDNCHSEFGGGQVTLPAGTILALDDEITINVGREKLAQMETIFSIVEDPSLPSNMLAVQLDFDRIRILTAADVFQRLNVLRGLSLGKPIVLNGVYLPAVMAVLGSLREGASGYEGLRWHRVFTAKCQHLGIQMEDPDLWRDAQRLLEMPFSEINGCGQFFGDS